MDGEDLRCPPDRTPAEPGDLALPDAAPVDLDDREAAVLHQLVPQPHGRTAFQGMRRRLDEHPQTLTRVLQRLEALDLVGRDDDGYFLAHAGADALLPEDACCPAGPRQQPMAAGVLPPTLDPGRVQAELAGRWFDDLRWFGWRALGEARDLVWLTEPGGTLVTLRVHPRGYVLAAEPRDEAPHPVVPARSLLSAVAELMAEPDAPAAS